MGAEFAIEKEIALHATPEEVWRAIATESGLATWFMPMPIDPGSKLVTTWEPPHRLTSTTPPGGDGTTQAFEYVIEARQGGTALLRFVHRGFLGDDWSDEFEPMTGRGWAMYLFTLAQYFAHFAGRPAVYVQAAGPPSSDQGGRWPHLLAVLDLGERAAPGAAVRVDLPGLGAIEGVVDYLDAHFVGLRTADDLIRFHGRWPLGMSAAVSHHAYAGVPDPTALAGAWERWLAGAFS